MDTVIVLKFGGSSVADNDKLKLVANKIIEFYNKKNKVIVVVSAQGKTTDKLIKEAKELSVNPESREMDMLLSTGEQISISKLAILLNGIGYKAISLTGWQAGIKTDNLNQNAKIKNIDITRITQELDQNKIVIVAGFQGIDEKKDITTLGRGGSDTTAVAIAAAIGAKECYIYSDVDGIYSSDPKIINSAKKIDNISYEEMLEISNEGAKVLHNRCVEIGRKYDIPIIAKSTFNNNNGTIIKNIDEKLEETKVKTIVKNDEISKITIVGYGIVNDNSILKKVINIIENEHLKILNLDINASKISIVFANKIENHILEQFHKELIN